MIILHTILIATFMYKIYHKHFAYTNHSLPFFYIIINYITVYLYYIHFFG